METLLADICESKILTENSNEGIRSNVYSLGVIRLFAGFTKLSLFLLTCVEVIPNWRARKWSERDDCLVFIENNVLGGLKWQMKRSSYLVDDVDLEVKTEE